jgi:hypothetical protein
MFCRSNTFSLEESGFWWKKDRCYEHDVDENIVRAFEFIDTSGGDGQMGIENGTHILISDKVIVSFGLLQVLVTDRVYTGDDGHDSAPLFCAVI